MSTEQIALVGAFFVAAGMWRTLERIAHHLLEIKRIIAHQAGQIVD